jgi:hypothetical protein
MGFPEAARGAILRPMGKRPPTDSKPDLFTSPAASGERTAPHLPRQTISRTVLPADLPSALTHLKEGELRNLAEAVTAELRRRKLPTPRAEQESERTKPPRKTSGPKLSVATERTTLPQGKLNAIRAAVKAGVKPTMIARQFGVSLAAIRKALEGMK